MAEQFDVATMYHLFGCIRDEIRAVNPAIVSEVILDALEKHLQPVFEKADGYQHQVWSFNRAVTQDEKRRAKEYYDQQEREQEGMDKKPNLVVSIFRNGPMPLPEAQILIQSEPLAPGIIGPGAFTVHDGDTLTLSDPADGKWIISYGRILDWTEACRLASAAGKADVLQHGVEGK